MFRDDPLLGLRDVTEIVCERRDGRAYEPSRIHAHGATAKCVADLTELGGALARYAIEEQLHV